MPKKRKKRSSVVTQIEYFANITVINFENSIHKKLVEIGVSNTVKR